MTEHKHGEEHEPTPTEIAERRKLKAERLRDIVVICLVVVSVVASMGAALTSYAVYNQTNRRSITIDALEQFAKNGNCNDIRSQAFQDMILVYLDSSDKDERDQAKAIYKRIQACPKVDIQGHK